MSIETKETTVIKNINKYSAKLDENEPLCSLSLDRFVLFPIQSIEIWQMYKEHVAVFWTPEEIDLSQDKKDWLTLSKSEQDFIKKILAFFAASDGIVLENISTNFINKVTLPEARCFYGFQIAMEKLFKT